MTEITHEEQKVYWEMEHSNPSEITQIDAKDFSSGVKLLYQWLGQDIISIDRGIEMCCGKGRNVLGLASLGIEMNGFDFSSAAITEAKKRASKLEITSAHFIVHDAMRIWPYPTDNFNIGLDCFATDDLENPLGRLLAVSEMERVLTSGGLLLVYTLSADDEWSKTRLQQSPLTERNTYRTPLGKFEKCFDRDELIELYSGLTLVEHKRIKKLPDYDGVVYPAQHHWMIFQKIA